MDHIHDAVIERRPIVVGSLHRAVQPHCHSPPRCPDIGLDLIQAPMADHRLVVRPMLNKHLNPSLQKNTCLSSTPSATLRVRLGYGVAMQTNSSTHLGVDERETLSLGRVHGHSLQIMARVLGRVSSTVNCKHARNARGHPYRACTA